MPARKAHTKPVLCIAKLGIQSMETVNQGSNFIRLIFPFSPASALVQGIDENADVGSIQYGGKGFLEERQKIVGVPFPPVNTGLVSQLECLEQPINGARRFQEQLIQKRTQKTLTRALKRITEAVEEKGQCISLWTTCRFSPGS